MDFVYLDVSGNITQHGVGVFGLVKCSDPRLPQKIMNIPQNASDDVRAYFREYSEYKFSAMCRASPRVQRLLEEKLVRIGREPALELGAVVVKNKDEELRLSLSGIDTLLRRWSDAKIVADKGSLEQLGFFMRIKHISSRITQGFGAIVLTSPAEKRLKSSVTDQIDVGGGQTFDRQILPVRHASSHEIKGLQIADLVAGAVFQTECRNSRRWLEMIKAQTPKLFLAYE